MTIQSDFETLIDELETNLQAMGVYDAEFDATTGIRGLVARIVDINPSLTGVALTTAVSCSSSHQTVVMGNTITISGVLTATYDDRSVTNVDLSGYLQGATINIYNGQTLLGTAITDSNGAYTFSYTTNTITNLSILAQFDGTDDYSSCSSSNVAVSVIGEITVTSNKNILSAADHETATLTAHLTDTVIENVSINFYKEGNNMTKTLIGTATTDANGVATITYTATGAGDITIQAESENNGNLLIQTYSIEDCWRANPLTSNDNLFSCVNSKCNCSYSSNGLYANHTGTGVDFYVLNSVPSGNHSVEFEISALGYGDADYCDSIIFNGVYLLQNNSNGYQIRRLDESAQSWNTPKLAVGDKVKAEISNGTVSIYVNGTLKGSKSSYNSQTGLYLNAPTRSITVKNLKIKPL